MPYGLRSRPLPGWSGLVFPDRNGNARKQASINREFRRVELAAGVTWKQQESAPNPGDDGDANGSTPKFRLHSLRYFFAAWCLRSIKAGGLGLPTLTVARLLGISSIEQMQSILHLFRIDVVAIPAAAKPPAPSPTGSPRSPASPTLPLLKDEPTSRTINSASIATGQHRTES